MKQIQLFFFPTITLRAAVGIAKQIGKRIGQDGRGNLTLEDLPQHKELIRTVLRESRVDMGVEKALSQKSMALCLKNVINIRRKK